MLIFLEATTKGLFEVCLFCEEHDLSEKCREFRQKAQKIPENDKDFFICGEILPILEDIYNIFADASVLCLNENDAKTILLIRNQVHQCYRKIDPYCTCDAQELQEFQDIPKDFILKHFGIEYAASFIPSIPIHKVNAKYLAFTENYNEKEEMNS